ncbi:MAG TPA: 4a-hydroxytetrahydrobiopterin dehydratase [Candidatus Paceibacterota bacterium]
MDLAQKKCVPCEAGSPPLSRSSAEALLLQITGWNLSVEAKKISKTFKFKNFREAISFANAVAEIAEKEGHHPDLFVSWGKVKVELTTHSIGGLSENDFILAAKINKII